MTAGNEPCAGDALVRRDCFVMDIRFHTILQIESLMWGVVHDIANGIPDGCVTMVCRTRRNAMRDEVTGAVQLGNEVTRRFFSAKSALTMSRLFEVLAAVHALLLSGHRVSQRQLFYTLLHAFPTQMHLNEAVLDASATLGVPRYLLNVGAATRGVVAGCISVYPNASRHAVDCEYVGPVRLDILCVHVL